MEIICKSCEARFKLPDDKLPPGKTLNVPCPKCKAPITVGAASDGQKPAENDVYDAGDRPFDFVEEEGRTALICEPDPERRAFIAKTLDMMEYYVREAKSTRDALKLMRYHTFDLAVVNERFDTSNPDVNGVLVFLERLSMHVRRNIFVLLMTERYRTMDHMMAFNRSVNFVMNVKDLDDFEKILNKGIADHEYFYRAFKDALRESGQIV